MTFKQVTESFFVSPQINADDVRTAAEQGFKAIVNNRPDGEKPGQPNGESIRKEAEAHGLEYRFIPIGPRGIRPGQTETLTDLITLVDGPVLAYCRSGTRSVGLWAVANAQDLGVNEVITAAADAGYDLSTLRDRLSSV